MGVGRGFPTWGDPPNRQCGVRDEQTHSLFPLTDGMKYGLRQQGEPEVNRNIGAAAVLTLLLISTLPAGSSPPPGDFVYLFLNDGQIISGTIITEDESSITIRPESGEERRIARGDIERQATSGEIRVELREGSVLVGRIILRDSSRTTIETASLGRVVMSNDRIATLQHAGSPEEADDLPQDTRLTFITNGFGLKRGEGYYQNVWVLGNLVAYGLTDHLSISAGLVPLFFFDGTPSPGMLGLKASIPLDDEIHLGIGGQAGTLLFDGDMFFGDAYGVLTFGSRQSHINVGGGALFNDEDDLPVIAFGGVTKVSRRWSLISENYLFPTEDFGGGLSFGGRFLTGDASIDFALAVPIGLDIGGSIILPWLGVTIPF